MKFFILIPVFFFLFSCNKPKTVLICGDHICINKKEAQHYFEENLTIEVKLVNKKEIKKENLIELNLREDKEGKKRITVSSKPKTNNNLKILSKEEVIEIKKEIKNKDEYKKNSKQIDKEKRVKIDKDEKKQNTNKTRRKDYNNVNKKNKDVFDICTILEKCSIDEISKYLIKQGINKDFPDITLRN